MQGPLQRGWLRLLRRAPLAALLLYCLGVARVQSQPPLGAPDVTTTQMAGSALFEARSWTPLFKLCMGAGSHDVVVSYKFPSSAATSLGVLYNITDWTAPWIMLYPESNWQDSYFYIVSVKAPAVPSFGLHLPHRVLQGDCMGRVSSIDPVFAQEKKKGGYRQFADMTVQSTPAQDPYLGAAPLVSYKDEFVVSAGANATIYFALRYCSTGGIPFPMRFEVTVSPQPLIKGIPNPKPFGAVCSLSSLKEAAPNSNVKSVICESDVGKCDQAAALCQ